MSSIETDAIVVGAGPAGCAAATVLAEHGEDAYRLVMDSISRAE